MNAFFVAGAILASSQQPYIDQIREKLGPKESSESYAESLRQKLPEKAIESSYIEKLKSENPEKYEKKPEEEKWLDEQARKLPPKETGGAIAAVHEGRSELKARYVGDVKHAFGLRYGASLNREITASAGTILRSFSDVYGANSAPDLAFFFEYPLVRHENLGVLGLQGSLGISYFHGQGSMRFNLEKPWAPGQKFGDSSRTLLQFYSLPAALTFNYRFNLFKYLKPFVAAGPTAILFAETRNDRQEGHRGVSKAIYTAGGLSFLMDGLMPREAWESYKDFGIRHSYLTLEYDRLSSIGSDVQFSVSGWVAGVTFEY